MGQGLVAHHPRPLLYTFTTDQWLAVCGSESSQCPPTDQVCTDYSVEMDNMLTQNEKMSQKADSVLENSTLGGRIAHSVLETHPQDILTGCGETYLSDTGHVTN